MVSTLTKISIIATLVTSMIAAPFTKAEAKDITQTEVSENAISTYNGLATGFDQLFEGHEHRFSNRLLNSFMQIFLAAKPISTYAHEYAHMTENTKSGFTDVEMHFSPFGHSWIESDDDQVKRNAWIEINSKTVPKINEFCQKYATYCESKWIYDSPEDNFIRLSSILKNEDISITRKRWALEQVNFQVGYSEINRTRFEARYQYDCEEFLKDIDQIIEYDEEIKKIISKKELITDIAGLNQQQRIADLVLEKSITQSQDNFNQIYMFLNSKPATHIYSTKITGSKKYDDIRLMRAHQKTLGISIPRKDIVKNSLACLALSRSTYDSLGGLYNYLKDGTREFKISTFKSGNTEITWPDFNFYLLPTGYLINSTMFGRTQNKMFKIELGQTNDSQTRLGLKFYDLSDKRIKTNPFIAVSSGSNTGFNVGLDTNIRINRNLGINIITGYSEGDIFREVIENQKTGAYIQGGLTFSF